MKYRTILRGIGKGLCIVGAMWMLPSSVPVMSGIYILLHADGYLPAEFEVAEVVFSRGHGEDTGSFFARGTINNRDERLPLYEIAGIDGGWLSVFSSNHLYPRSQRDADKYAEQGQIIKVHYNPKALNMDIGCENMRVLVYHEMFPEFYSKRLFQRDLPVCLVPLLLGLILLITGRFAIMDGYDRNETGQLRYNKGE